MRTLSYRHFAGPRARSARGGWGALLAALALSAVTALGAAGDEGFAPARLPLSDVVLEGVSGERRRLADLDGRPVLIVVADRAASEAAAEWGRSLAGARPRAFSGWDERGRVGLVSVADLRAVPAPARPIARWIVARFARAQQGDLRSGGFPLLLDFGGSIAGRIGASARGARLALLDRERRVVLSLAGSPDPASVDRVAAAIDHADADADARGDPR